MLKNNGDRTAFPGIEPGHTDGLSKREYIATQALSGLLASEATPMFDSSGKLMHATLALHAVCLADALLAELAMVTDVKTETEANNGKVR